MCSCQRFLSALVKEIGVRLVASEFVSLDGVMEDPGGSEQSAHGGWTLPYWNDDVARFKYDELFAGDALLLGRATYEGFAKAWPTMKDDQGFADRMNSIPKYVVSRTLGNPTWNNTKSIRVNAKEEVLKLKAGEGRDILVFGSARLVHGLTRAGLVDEYRFLVYPVVLAHGKRIFEGEHYQKLNLLEARQLGQVTLLRYELAANAIGP